MTKDEQDLVKKYRPRKFSELLGQEEAVELLRGHILGGTAWDLHYLIMGDTGTGKTSLARILSAALSCPKREDGRMDGCGECQSCESILLTQQGLDYEECNAADVSGVDYVRELRTNAQLFPMGGAERKIFVIDEAHKLSKEAKSAYLGLLELELKSRFIFVTMEPNKLPVALKDRLTPIQLCKVDSSMIYRHLVDVCVAEQLDYDPENLDWISKEAKGLMRSAMRQLDAHKHMV